MKIAVQYGLECGHTSEKKEIVFHPDIKPRLDLDLVKHEYCERCNDFLLIKRIVAFIIERDISEIV